MEFIFCGLVSGLDPYSGDLSINMFVFQTLKNVLTLILIGESVAKYVTCHLNVVICAKRRCAPCFHRDRLDIAVVRHCQSVKTTNSLLILSFVLPSYNQLYAYLFVLFSQIDSVIVFQRLTQSFSDPSWTLSVADNNPSGLLITTVTSTDRKNVDALPLSRTDAAYFDFMDNGDMSQLQQQQTVHKHWLGTSS